MHLQTRQFASIQPNVRFFKAIDGLSEVSSITSQELERYYGNSDRLRVAGLQTALCRESYLRCPQRDQVRLTMRNTVALDISYTRLFDELYSKRESEPVAVILEDDAVLNVHAREFLPRVRSLLGQLPSDWDVFLLYSHRFNGYRDYVSRDIQLVLDAVGTAAFVVKTSRCQVFNDLLKELLPFDYQIDTALLGYGAQTWRLNVYGTQNIRLIRHGQFSSSIRVS